HRRDVCIGLESRLFRATICYGITSVHHLSPLFSASIHVRTYSGQLMIPTPAASRRARNSTASLRTSVTFPRSRWIALVSPSSNSLRLFICSLSSSPLRAKTIASELNERSILKVNRLLARIFERQCEGQAQPADFIRLDDFTLANFLRWSQEDYGSFDGVP